MFLSPCELIPAEMFNTASVHAIGILDATGLVPCRGPFVGIFWPSQLELEVNPSCGQNRMGHESHFETKNKPTDLDMLGIF